MNITHQTKRKFCTEDTGILSLVFFQNIGLYGAAQMGGLLLGPTIGAFGAGAFGGIGFVFIFSAITAVQSTGSASEATGRTWCVDRNTLSGRVTALFKPTAQFQFKAILDAELAK